MNLSFTAEQDELRAAVRRFLADRSPMAEVRRLTDTADGYDRDTWRRMAEQLGLQGLAVAEEHGGAGCGYVELTVVVEEMGRALLPGPFLATVGLALPALLAAGDEPAAKELLPGVASGDTVATLAWVEDDGAWDGRSPSTSARRDGAGWRLDGHKSFVLDGHVAGLLLVVARTDDGLGLFAVDGAADGLDRTLLPTLDQTRRLARLSFSDAPARLLGDPAAGERALAEALDRAAILLAAEMVGGAQACLDMSVEYAKVREQFDRPIGSFQAVKHKCAEMLVHVEAARAAAYYAGFAVGDSPEEVPAVASLAKAYAAEAYFHAAAENVQIHGGIGFTWEHDAHLYLKRAKSSDLLLGDVGFHRRRLADRIGL